MKNYETKLKKKKKSSIVWTLQEIPPYWAQRLAIKNVLTIWKAWVELPPPPPKKKKIMDMFGVGMFHALSYPIETMTHDSSHESTKSNYLLYILFN